MGALCCRCFGGRVTPPTPLDHWEQDEDNVKDALRYSAAMLGELRTSSLGPQKYYEMYMQVSDQLHFLTVRFCVMLSAGSGTLGSEVGSPTGEPPMPDVGGGRQCCAALLWAASPVIPASIPRRLRNTLRMSTARGDPTLTCMSWSSTQATSSLGCKYAKPCHQGGRGGD